MVIWKTVDTLPRDGSKFLYSGLYEGKRFTSVGCWGDYPAELVACYGLRPGHDPWTTYCIPSMKNDRWAELPEFKESKEN